VYAIPVEVLFPQTFGAGGSHWISILIGMAYSIPKSFIVAPLLIAVHRYVILGETTRGFSIHPAGRYLSFAGCAIAFEIAIEAPAVAIQAFALPVKLTAIAAGFPPVIALVLLPVIATMIVPLLLLPTLMVFPAIAIDAPRVKAWRKGIRHYWRLCYTMALAWLPAIAIFMSYLAVMRVLIGTLPLLAKDPPLAFLISSTVFSGAMTVFLGAVFAAAVSRLYRSFTGMDARA